MPKSYWMVAITLENFQTSESLGFKVHGFSVSQRKRTERMQPEDRLLFYIRDVQRFGATATVTSTSFEDRSPIWKSLKDKEVYLFRIHIKPDVVLKDEDLADARQIGPRLDYVKKWQPETWHLAFFGELHLLPKRDFKLIEDEMKKLGRRQRRGEGRPLPEIAIPSPSDPGTILPPQESMTQP